MKCHLVHRPLLDSQTIFNLLQESAKLENYGITDYSIQVPAWTTRGTTLSFTYLGWEQTSRLLANNGHCIGYGYNLSNTPIDKVFYMTTLEAPCNRSIKIYHINKYDIVLTGQFFSDCGWRYYVKLLMCAHGR